LVSNDLGVKYGSIYMNDIEPFNPIKTPNLYECTICYFNTSNKKDYTRHLTTAKHTKKTRLNQIEPIIPINTPTHHICIDCNKEYTSKSGLWYHKKKCTGPLQLDNQKRISNKVDATLVIELLKQNTEFKHMMIEQNKHILDQNEKITELAKNAGNVTNNTTNNTTNKFNLNVFLNETCKDAITMNEFINSIEVTMEDFVRTGKLGFVDGISTVMVERIKGMDMHTRPMHCTDLKRETMYIKNDDAWEKGDIDKTLLRRAVKNVANKNYRQLKPWFDSSQPEVDQIGTDEYENYFQYYKSALGGCGKEEDRKFEDKIIKNVLKEVVVDK